MSKAQQAIILLEQFEVDPDQVSLDISTHRVHCNVFYEKTEAYKETVRKLKRCFGPFQVKGDATSRYLQGVHHTDEGLTMTCDINGLYVCRIIDHKEREMTEEEIKSLKAEIESRVAWLEANVVRVPTYTCEVQS